MQDNPFGSCHDHTRPALAVTACVVSWAKLSRATTHCLWLWCLWFWGHGLRSLVYDGLRSKGTACKFHVVDFISLQRTIRKICTLCPRKILFFFPLLRLCLPLLLLLLLLLFAAAAFELLVAKAATGDSSWANWNPIAVDFLRNSLPGKRIASCELYLVEAAGDITGLRTNESALCAHRVRLSSVYPGNPFSLPLYARLMATC